MFGAKQTDTDRLIQAGDRALKAYQHAQSALDWEMTEWNKLQDAAEVLAARLEAFDQTASHGGAGTDVLWRNRLEAVRTELQNTVARRDAQILPITEEVERWKAELFQLNSTVAGSFGNWAYRVANGLPDGDPLRTELEQARRQVEQMYLGSTRDIVAIVQRLVDKVEANEALDVPLFRFAALAEKAAPVQG